MLVTIMLKTDFVSKECCKEQNHDILLKTRFSTAFCSVVTQHVPEQFNACNH